MSSQGLLNLVLDSARSFTKSDVSVLIIADENFPVAALANLPTSLDVLLITNRFDLAETNRATGINTVFSDFDFSMLSKRFDIIVYHISKERAVCHYIFNHVHSLIDNEGWFIIGGKKNQGIKNYHQKLCKQAGYSGALKKNGDDYFATMRKPATPPKTPLFDDKSYSVVRQVSLREDLRLFSKPGVYGWDKCDKGSQLLIQKTLKHCHTRLSDNSHISCLDLGCGYGFLSHQAISHATFKLSRLVATDNCAGAILCAKKNLSAVEKSLEILVTADDCGSSLTERFDLILCNPPFHQGFENDRQLTHKFLKNAARLLSKHGYAYFVVNSFIPLERLARDYFKNIETLENTAQFKVACLSH